MNDAKNLYQLAREMPCGDAFQYSREAKSYEEMRFWISIFNMNLQRKQREVVAAESLYRRDFLLEKLAAVSERWQLVFKAILGEESGLPMKWRTIWTIFCGWTMRGSPRLITSMQKSWMTAICLILPSLCLLDMDISIS